MMVDDTMTIKLLYDVVKIKSCNHKKTTIKVGDVLIGGLSINSAIRDKNRLNNYTASQLHYGENEMCECEYDLVEKEIIDV